MSIVLVTLQTTTEVETDEEKADLLLGLSQLLPHNKEFETLSGCKFVIVFSHMEVKD